MTREELVQTAIKLMNTNTSVALLWATGVGKSVAAIKMANKYLEKVHSGKVLLVVAETPHKDNWTKEFEKWGMINASLTVECYASLHKYRNTQWDLIIYDEAHHLGSDLRLEILSTIKSKKNILLSATMDRGMLNLLESSLGYIAWHRITLQDAIDFDILPGPHIHLIPLTLNNDSKTCIIEESWGEPTKQVPLYCDIAERWTYLKNKKKYPNVVLKMRCTELQKYYYLNNQFEYWKSQFMRTKKEFAKNKWLKTGLERKIFLGESKSTYVLKLIDYLSRKKKRFICFCTNIEQAELLGGENAIHSKKKKGGKTTLEAFNNLKIDSLYAVGMLQEGQNLKNIEAGIIVQLDGTERPFIQKLGRSLRAEDPHQYIFYYKNTRDQEYLDAVLEDLNDSLVDEIDITTLTK